MFQLLQQAIYKNKLSSSNNENRKPVEIIIDTKKFLLSNYCEDKDKIINFENSVYNESFCFIKLKSDFTDEININSSYIILLQECLIHYLKHNENNTNILVDGDVIIDLSFSSYKDGNKLIYYNNEIHDLYIEINENGTVPPEISYPTFPFDFPTTMGLNSTQWIECNVHDFKEQLIKNICFQPLQFQYKNKSVEILLCTTKINYNKETILIDINLENLEITEGLYYDFDGHIDKNLQTQVKSILIKFFSSSDKIFILDSSITVDNLFDKYDNYFFFNPIKYFSLLGGIKNNQLTNFEQNLQYKDVTDDN